MCPATTDLGQTSVLKFALSKKEEMALEAETNLLIGNETEHLLTMTHYEPGAKTPLTIRGAVYFNYSYMVIPYAKEGTLLAHLSKRSLTAKYPLETQKYLCSQVVACVAELHTTFDIAHMNIKLEHFVMMNKKLKLIDFSMAVELGQPIEDSEKMAR